MAGEVGSSLFAAVLYQGDQYDEVVNFYNDWTASDPSTWFNSLSTWTG